LLRWLMYVSLLLPLFCPLPYALRRFTFTILFPLLAALCPLPSAFALLLL
jgi:hypothetical protein